MTDQILPVFDHFLARYGVVCAFPWQHPSEGSSGQSEKLCQALDVMLAESYHVFISKELRNYLKSFSNDELLRFWNWFERVWKEAGKEVRGEECMIPLKGRFPNEIPEDMETLWIKRFLSFWQPASEKCLICGKDHTVIELEPCHHLVCTECFSGYTGCPLCGRPVDKECVLRKGLDIIYTADRNAWGPMSRIDFEIDIERFAKGKFEIFCGSAQALSSQDLETLRIILNNFPEKIALWLPERFASRQVMAIVLGALMTSVSEASEDQILRRYLKNATDVLRLIAVMSGEDGTLMPHPVNVRVASSGCEKCSQEWRRGVSYQFKVTKMSRKQRRMFLQILESFDEDALKEDMIRRRALWVRVGELLHPGDYENRFPKVMAAFRVIRKKYIDKSGPREIAYRTWRSRLETAIETHDMKQLELLMKQRPGEFARHIDRILRGFASHEDAGSFASGQISDVKETLLSNLKKRSKLWDTLKQFTGGVGAMISTAAGDISLKSRFVYEFSECLPKLSTPMLVQLWGHLGRRQQKLKKRIFYPAGCSRKIYWMSDKRYTINPLYTRMLRNAIAKELLNRFAKQTHFDQAVIDESIKTLTFPFNERSSGSQAIHLSSGSYLSLPPEENGGKLRLFLHWCEKAESRRVDLDLSVAFYDDSWEMKEGCAYYNLQCPRNGSKSRKFYAHHSGDFQAAPYPNGATEYVDLDRSLAIKEGIRYAVMLVQVYAGVDFNELERAYAGVMYRSNLDKTAQFDPKTVRYKYALSGETNSYIPIIFDLVEEKIYDAQCYLSGRGRLCNLESNATSIHGIAQAMIEFYRDCPRTMRDEIALMQAAARCGRVWLRHEDGKATLFVRGENESTRAFYNRLVNRKQMISDHQNSTRVILREGEYQSVPEFDTATLAFLMDGDLALSAGSEYYIIFNGMLSEKFAWTELLNI